jgi:hypothetical protein
MTDDLFLTMGAKDDLAYVYAEANEMHMVTAGFERSGICSLVGTSFWKHTSRGSAQTVR